MVSVETNGLFINRVLLVPSLLKSPKSRCSNLDIMNYSGKLLPGTRSLLILELVDYTYLWDIYQRASYILCEIDNMIKLKPQSDIVCNIYFDEAFLAPRNTK